MIRISQLTALVASGILMNSCTQVGDSWVLGNMAAAAHDQIMLVRSEPPSFGFRRMASQARVYPDIAVFVSQRGLPDFLAETGSRERQYFILYYLKDREAFACRTRPEGGESVQFAGPYPITDREFSLLDNFRRDPNRKPSKF